MLKQSLPSAFQLATISMHMYVGGGNTQKKPTQGRQSIVTHASKDSTFKDKAHSGFEIDYMNKIWTL